MSTDGMVIFSLDPCRDAVSPAFASDGLRGLSHLLHLETIFKKLAEYNLVVKISKCEFAKSELLFLGHIVSKDGISTDPTKCTKSVQKVIIRILMYSTNVQY